MSSGSGERRAVVGAIIALIGVVAVLVVRAKRTRVDPSLRARQHTRAGEPIEAEWGKASFPASDPPQSW